MCAFWASAAVIDSAVSWVSAAQPEEQETWTDASVRQRLLDAERWSVELGEVTGALVDDCLRQILRARSTETYFCVAESHLDKAALEKVLDDPETCGLVGTAGKVAATHRTDQTGYPFAVVKKKNKFLAADSHPHWGHLGAVVDVGSPARK